MKIQNMINGNNNTVPNQFIINSETGVTFQSYDSKICFDETKNILGNPKLFLYGNMWDYSNTTRKYFKQFINEETSFTYINEAQWLKEIQENDSIKVL